jgi:hypothetical protein
MSPEGSRCSALSDSLCWLSLSTPAKIADTIWMAAGIAFGAWKTRGFLGDLVNFDLPADET